MLAKKSLLKFNDAVAFNITFANLHTYVCTSRVSAVDNFDLPLMAFGGKLGTRETLYCTRSSVGVCSGLTLMVFGGKLGRPYALLNSL